MATDPRHVTIRPPDAAAGAEGLPPGIHTRQDAVIQAEAARADADALPPEIWIVPHAGQRASALAALYQARQELEERYPDLALEADGLIAKLEAPYSPDEINAVREQFFSEGSAWYLRIARNPDLQEFSVIIITSILRALSISDG